MANTTAMHKTGKRNRIEKVVKTSQQYLLTK